MDIDQIMTLLPHRYPFLAIDRVEEVEPGERAVAVKCVTVNEPHFQATSPDPDHARCADHRGVCANGRHCRPLRTRRSRWQDGLPPRAR